MELKSMESVARFRRRITNVCFGAVLLSVTFFFERCGLPSPEVTKVGIQGDKWTINGEPILKGSPAEGLLVNVRMVNAVFEDAGPAAEQHLPKDFDPDENTGRFIAAIPDYYAHGVRAFTVSLQGGSPGYEGAVNTAFNSDGSLRSSYMERVARVVRAADKEGAVILLSCFYQRQHSHRYALDGKPAIFHAVEEVVAWIEKNRFTNVVLEVSNEFAHGGYRQWKDGDWLRSVEGQVELIRFVKTKAPDLITSTAGMGSGVVPKAIAEAADFILLHFNRTSLNEITERIAEARRYGKPVLCNEDDKVGKIGAAAARLSVQAGAGWGFMHVTRNQTVPFRFDGVTDDTVVYRMLSKLTSPGASLVDADAEAPFVVVTSPVDGDLFPPGKSIKLRATVTGVDADGLALNFYAGKTKIAQCIAPPWETSWDNPPPGKYEVVAVLRDANGVELLRSGPADFEVRSE